MVALLAAALCCAVLTAPAGRAAGTGAAGRVEGQVTSWSTGRPVAGAAVSIRGEEATATSGAEGRFVFDRPLRVDGAYRRITAVVTAPGYGPWTISGVPVYPNDTLRLSARLRTSAYHDRVLTPQERMARAPQGPRAGPAATATCSGWDYQVVPPKTIYVWVTQDGRSEKKDFPTYLQHVLPSEWIPSWDADSLAAGAIAAKTYAAYRAMSGHARTSGAGCFDIYGDTRDQVYDPDYSYPTTDLAVDAALGSILYQNGGLFLSHYYAGASDDPCAPVEGQYAGWMSQWGTQTCATPPENLVWPDIVTTFYDNTSWKYLHNFMMNPEASSDPTYMWATLYGTLARTAGGYNGSWSWTVSATSPGRSATFRQDRKWSGTPTTKYHAEAALRCLTSNPRDCRIDMKVFAITSGGELYGRTKTITEPNDGVWRLYTYDPSASEVTHVKARLSIASEQDFGADSLYLDSPYGGP